MHLKIKYLGLLLKSFREHYRLNQLALYFVFLILLWVIGANTVYIAEKVVLQDFPRIYEKSDFSDYGSSYWNIIIYLLSGIEDKEPISTAGRVGAFLVLLSSIILVSIFTGTLTSIIIERVNHRQYIRLKPIGSRFKDHIIICGQNSILEGTISELYGLSKGNQNIVIVSENVGEIKKSKEFSVVWGVSGDPSDVETLKRADIETAKSVLILSPDNVTDDECDSANFLVVLASRKLNKDVYLCTQLKNPQNKKLFFDANVDEVIALEDFFNRLLTQTINIKGIGKFYRLLSKSDVDFGKIYKIPVPQQYLEEDLTFFEIRTRMIDEIEGSTLIGIEKNTDSKKLNQKRRFGYIEINPRKIKHNCADMDYNYKPKSGDSLIMLGNVV